MFERKALKTQILPCERISLHSCYFVESCVAQNVPQNEIPRLTSYGLIMKLHLQALLLFQSFFVLWLKSKALAEDVNRFIPFSTACCKQNCSPLFIGKLCCLIFNPHQTVCNSTKILNLLSRLIVAHPTRANKFKFPRLFHRFSPGRGMSWKPLKRMRISAALKRLIQTFLFPKANVCRFIVASNLVLNTKYKQSL